MRIYMTESNLVNLSSYAGTLQGGARETSRIWRRRRVAEIGFVVGWDFRGVQMKFPSNAKETPK